MDFPKTIFFEQKELADVYSALSRIKNIYPEASDTSLTHHLLQSLHIDEFKSRLASLERKVTLVLPSNISDDNSGVGRVCVYRVEVKPCDGKLTVVEPNFSIDQFKTIQLPKSILVTSDSVTVIDAKLAVYKKHESMFEDKKIRIIHEVDSNKEIVFLHHCAKSTIDSFQYQVEKLINSIPMENLKDIVEKAADIAFSKQTIEQGCQNIDIVREGQNIGSVRSSSYACRSPFTIRQIKEALISQAIQRVEQDFTNEVISGILKHIQQMLDAQLLGEVGRFNILVDLKILAFGSVAIGTIVAGVALRYLHPLLGMILTAATVASVLYTFVQTVDVNSVEWRNRIANEIYQKISGKKSEIVEDVVEKLKPICNQTKKELNVMNDHLKTASEMIPIENQSALIAEWQLRDSFRIKDTKRCPAILKFITGRKNGVPVMKVYLRKYDDESKRFCELNVAEKPRDYRFEYVDVEVELHTPKIDVTCDEEMGKSVPYFEQERITNILKCKRDELYAKHSNLIAIGMSPVECSHNGIVSDTPCVALYCFDAKLVPFGEEPLPSALSDTYGKIPCDIREDFFEFGSCQNCKELQNGCSVGRYGIESSGSVGFFVRRKSSSNSPHSPYDGFLTAAHVALDNNVLQEMNEIKFSKCHQGTRHIVHPSFQDSGKNNIIGEVEDSFFGNHDSTGVDVAFVKTYENQENGEMYVSSLSFNVRPHKKYEVVKHGRTTGERKGILIKNGMSFREDFPEHAGIYLVLDNCFTIYRHPSKPDKNFFELGDSGSAVYVLEADNTKHPIGLAFGVLKQHKITFASPIRTIAEILNLSVVQPAQPMNIP